MSWSIDHESSVAECWLIGYTDWESLHVAVSICKARTLYRLVEGFKSPDKPNISFWTNDTFLICNINLIRFLCCFEGARQRSVFYTNLNLVVKAFKLVFVEIVLEYNMADWTVKGFLLLINDELFDVDDLCGWEDFENCFAGLGHWSFWCGLRVSCGVAANVLGHWEEG